MKVLAISTQATPVHDVYQRAVNSGYRVFVYKHADAEQELGLNPFFYVGSDQELVEKSQLLRFDPFIRYELELQGT